MILDIKPLRDQRRNCFEDILATLAPYYSRDYELMFAESWNFSLIPYNTNSNLLLCDRIVIKHSNMFSFLQKYHGIMLKTYKCYSLSEVLFKINAELLTGNPTIISIPRYWCPWSPLYKKQLDNIKHSFIIIGIDKEKDSLICTDPFYMKYKVLLPIKELQVDYISVSTLDFLDIDVPINWQEILEQAVFQLKSKTDYFNNSFDAIRCLGIEIAQISNLNEQIHTNAESSLEKKIYDIDYSRRNFSILLEYIGNRYNGELIPLSNIMMQVAGKWNAVYSLLLKAYYKMNNTSGKESISILKRAGSIINQIADIEEQTSDMILEKLHKKPTRVSHVAYNLTQKKENVLDDNKFEFLNLSDFFNNNCFGKEASLACTADINERGSYIISVGLPNKKIWQIDNMKFSFPEVLEGHKNNISCLRQVIYVPYGKYSGIMILGCAVMGNQIENIEIEYDDEYTQKISLELTDAWFPEPIFGEKIAWQGQYVTRIHNAVEIIPHKINIYAHFHALTNAKNIVAIHLPYCPNIHIFAISLLK